ncbi:SDR family NAD(P)-dependent oxidoreductase [Micromonospora krabiensis]|uniref:NAD(P)-dependent dehydrogenase, short-chain alcohol dehydrogenase family n=1 Tax=Micromonospora krabiensis TaxID=307121 RepID=A0A1C3N953_9ACTN|nr:SDR family oxidoreductase [Micromonospora krabiensis]SBV29098.1 NAD(P)-dependent dehydrogenase, short-chain alcohol dehydrogenase family [Micromonospora krabiensis]
MQVAIVTGASSGIGQSAAVQLAKRGTGVILTYGRNQAGAYDTVAHIEKEGGTAVALPLDVGRTETFPAFRASVVAALRDTWQRDTFDHLVNNAGFSQMSMFEDTSEELFDRFLRVLLKGPYFLTQSLLPLQADGGAIVNVTSNSALESGLEPGYSGYATMKGGLAVLTRYLAKELSPRGIRVNAIAPGATRTRLADDAFEKYPEVIPALAAKTALGRVGEPDDIGMMIATLLGEEGRWITAQHIEVAGGYNL